MKIRILPPRLFPLLGLVAASSGALPGCGDTALHPSPAVESAERVEATGLHAGAAEAASSIPIGVPQGGYTSRAFPLSLPVDKREAPYTVQFVPSAGVATRIPIKVVWLQQGNAPLVFVKYDLIYAFEGLLFALEDAITEATGVDVHDRVLLSTNHSHGSYGDHSQDAAMYLGGDQFNREVFDRMVAEMRDVAVRAHSGLAPAAIGVGVDGAFDPIGVDQIFRDRRGENNDLPGVDGQPLGPGYKDPRLTLLRVDASKGTTTPSDDTPIAVVYHFGMHGTVLDDQPFLSTDAPGGVELKFQEQFDRPVVVMHMQGGAGDQSPAGSQDDWARLETIGEIAAPKIKALWSSTPTASGTAIGLDALTRSVHQDRDRMRVTRDGTVDFSYAPYRERGRPDNVVYNPDGSVKSPIDEFNTQYGAALCGSDVPVPGVLWSVGANVYPYQSCAQVEQVIRALELPILNYDLSWVTMPVQAAEQTVVSVVRLGNVPIHTESGANVTDDFVMGFFPGEPVSLFSDTFRDEVRRYWGYEHSICVGYAQDHEGYLLTVEDWLAGGYEPSINQWGPLQGEYVLEQAVALVGSLDGAPEPDSVVPDRDWSEILFPLEPVTPEITPEAGLVPAALPSYLFTRTGVMPTQAQPAAQVPRVTGVASFVWLGGDPAIDMPSVVLEKEGDSGEWAPVARRSGRTVNDEGYEMFVTYTPYPLQSARDRQHFYQVEWQAVTDQPSLDYMSGLPLGRYRFKATGHANKGQLDDFPYDGTTYVALSQPFEVVATPLLVSATGTTTSLSVTASYPATTSGWRLLSMTSDFRTTKALVGAGGATRAKVELINGSGAVVFTRSSVTFSSGGDASTATVTLSGVAPGSYTLRITDVFGNVGTSTVQL